MLESITNCFPMNEKSVLALWACSFTVKDTAKCLRMSTRAVNYYRSKLRLRFGVSKSSELINKMILMDDYEEVIELGKQLYLHYEHIKKIKNIYKVKS